MSPRIASLFSGTGALDLAVQAVFGGEVIWHCQYEPPDKNGREDKNQYAAKILARHWPSVPNLWDITKVCWQCVLEAYGLVDILTGGFPCTDVSTAGKRAGLTPDTRSGLWSHMARAIHILQPRLVIIENVEGLLSSQADRGLEPGAEALDPDAGAGGVLRALGAVLGDLATLGFHAEWQVVAASAVGAPHQRKRVIIYAWPAALDPRRFGWGNGPGIVGGLGTAGRDTQAVQDADLESRGERRLAAPGQAEGGRARSDAGGRGGAPTAHTCGQGLEVGRVEPDRHELPSAERGRGESAADAHDFGRRADVLDLRPGQPDLDWGDYGPAIRRWEAVLGRPAPWPTDDLGRLSPVFTEWLMGLPDGWVTATPGLTRPAMLRALGNGVVPQQAVAALHMLHARACEDTTEAAA